MCRIDRGCWVSICAFVGGLLLTIGCSDQPASVPAAHESDKPAASAPSTTPIAKARRLFGQGELDAAESCVREILLRLPSDPNALLLSADIKVARQQYQQAIQIASLIPATDTQFSRSQIVIANCVTKLGGDISESEDLAWRAMEHALTTLSKPNSAASSTSDPLAIRRCLIAMLNRRGYRNRACQHVEFLCQIGQANSSELLSLVARRNAFPNQDTQTSDDIIQAEQSNGPMAIARRLHTNRHYAEAYQALLPQRKTRWSHPEQAALFGTILADQQAWDEIPGWAVSCPKNADRYSEYWSAIGSWFFANDQMDLATGSFLRAVEIDPSSAVDYKRLARCAEKSTTGVAPQRFAARAMQIDRMQAILVMIRQNPDSIELQSEMAAKWLELGRPLEYLQWTANGENVAPQQAAMITRKRRDLLARRDFAEMQNNDARMQITHQQYPPPSNEQLAIAFRDRPTNVVFATTPNSPASSSDIRITDVADAVGIRFEYLNGSPRTLKYFRLHETLGGGISVIDFDCDGNPDLYMGQGSGDPPDVIGDKSNQLFRNHAKRFVDATEAAGLIDYGYTTGLAAGDVNQDGFPDLMIGNLGKNRLLINQGDGTFSDSTHRLGNAPPMYTTSLAIADVTGDGLPDIVETNYVDDTKLYQSRVKPNDRLPSGISPSQFANAPDRVFQSNGNRSFTSTPLETSGEDSASSLGVVVTNIDSEPGNEILVANDVWPNRLWKRNTTSGWNETASVDGIAFDCNGTATAGMGIASGDFDADGNLDFHITNFWEQSSSLFLQTSPGTFTDLAPRYNLVGPTFAMLGFGTQSLDINRDGWLDLMILNGQIEDFSAAGHPFRMRPQCFLGTGGQMNEVPIEGPSGYFQRKQLGRTLARVDWNRDGRWDFVASHLDAPSALLENQTDSTGHWIQFQLVGVNSERDAIGARVIVRSGDTSRSTWRTAGDGYLCNNEPILDVGLGDRASISDVTIYWPRGNTQTITDVAVDHRYLIVENQSGATKIALNAR
ncbi:CRTAC1 family protein [Rubripirellula reticaptiva]|uniref:ASPIC and UnbV n=1 Tax=Rubripirellula reticaptiva TaxID=2528013 RepID=A0A5C6FCR2_9BACT|nr:CRTAC1 family protein [Rubripirellula reticaptiva]TWU57429.1 ASPIC and UnbV [Rubripirellula reticaptiva]